MPYERIVEKPVERIEEVIIEKPVMCEREVKKSVDVIREQEVIHEKEVKVS